MASLQACNTCLHHYSLATQRGVGMRTAYIDWLAMCCVLCFTYAVFFYPSNWPVILNHLHFTDEGVETRKEGSLVLVHRVGLGFESKLWGSMLSPQLWPGLQPAASPALQAHTSNCFLRVFTYLSHRHLKLLIPKYPNLPCQISSSCNFPILLNSALHPPCCSGPRPQSHL